MKQILALILLLASLTGWAQDARYCGPPERDALGTIVRSRQVLRDFQAIYPCPANGQPAGACPGWQINHVRPLSACGCDSIENLQWMPSVMKSGPGSLPVDRWERRIYKCPGAPLEITPMPSSAVFRLGVIKR